MWSKSLFNTESMLYMGCTLGYLSKLVHNLSYNMHYILERLHILERQDTSYSWKLGIFSSKSTPTTGLEQGLLLPAAPPELHMLPVKVPYGSQTFGISLWLVLSFTTIKYGHT